MKAVFSDVADALLSRLLLLAGALGGRLYEWGKEKVVGGIQTAARWLAPLSLPGFLMSRVVGSDDTAAQAEPEAPAAPAPDLSDVLGRIVLRRLGEQEAEPVRVPGPGAALGRFDAGMVDGSGEGRVAGMQAVGLGRVYEVAYQTQPARNPRVQIIEGWIEEVQGLHATIRTVDKASREV